MSENQGGNGKPESEYRTANLSATPGVDGGVPQRVKKTFEESVRRALRAMGARFSRLGARIAIAWRPLGTKLRRFVSPVFLGMLILSFFLWYLIKLGYTYTTELPVNLNIGGREIKATVVAEGVGYRLMSYRFSSRKNISIDWSDVETSLSASNPQAVVISPYSLQNIISMRNPDIRVLSMGTIPEIEL